MNKKGATILTINGGSSSIKFAVFTAHDPLVLLFSGAVDRIGSKQATLRFCNLATSETQCTGVIASDHNQAALRLIEWLEAQSFFDSIKAIGHRIVQGMQHNAPQKVTTELIRELRQFSSYDPEHMPEEIALIELFGAHFPALEQIACFDTSFHTSVPAVAKMLGIPRRFYNKGIRRYGFHGLSYAYLMEALEGLEGSQVALGRVILAHLGNGASLAAVKDGKSMDTSMGFTPASGLVMGTRSGDLDPGVAWYLMQIEKMSPKAFNHLVNHESGLLGISETSADMRDLTETEASDSRAQEAIEVFCYQIKKWIGSYAAVLGGVDVLVFSGGIGEHSPLVRSKVCDGLLFLGIELDEIKNMNQENIISTPKSSVKVFVINTNEEVMIAKMVYDLLHMRAFSDFAQDKI